MELVNTYGLSFQSTDYKMGFEKKTQAVCNEDLAITSHKQELWTGESQEFPE